MTLTPLVRVRLWVRNYWMDMQVVALSGLLYMENYDLNLLPHLILYNPLFFMHNPLNPYSLRTIVYNVLTTE